MKNIFIILIISLSFIKIVNSENVTMKYGGDWVNTTVIQNGDFMSKEDADTYLRYLLLKKISDVIT